MKNFTVLCSIAVFTLITSGCMTTKKMNAIMGSWVGHNVNDLIAAWGPPAQVMSDGNGGQIFVYDQSGSVTLPGQSTTTSSFNATATGTYNQYGNTGHLTGNAYSSGQTNTTYTPPQTIAIQRTRMFWIDRNGRVYRWSWRGL